MHHRQPPSTALLALQLCVIGVFAPFMAFLASQGGEYSYSQYSVGFCMHRLLISIVHLQPLIADATVHQPFDLPQSVPIMFTDATKRDLQDSLHGLYFSLHRLTLWCACVCFSTTCLRPFLFTCSGHHDGLCFLLISHRLTRSVLSEWPSLSGTCLRSLPIENLHSCFLGLCICHGFSEQLIEGAILKVVLGRCNMIASSANMGALTGTPTSALVPFGWY